MSNNDDKPILEEVLPANEEISLLKDLQGTSFVVVGSEESTLITNTTAPIKVSGPVTIQSTSKPPAAVAVAPINKHDIRKVIGASMLYEKDDNWVLEKIPPYTFRKKAAIRSAESQNLPPRRKCCLENDSMPLSFTQNIKAIYDVLSGKESYPCNECDRPICQESIWHWLSSVVIDVVDAMKTKQIDSVSSGCGTTDVDTLRTNTKGTFADLDDSSSLSPPKPSGETKTQSPIVKSAKGPKNAFVEVPENVDMKIELVENPDERPLEVGSAGKSGVQSIIELYESKIQQELDEQGTSTIPDKAPAKLPKKKN